MSNQYSLQLRLDRASFFLARVRSGQFFSGPGQVRPSFSGLGHVRAAYFGPFFDQFFGSEAIFEVRTGRATQNPARVRPFKTRVLRAKFRVRFRPDPALILMRKIKTLV